MNQKRTFPRREAIISEAEWKGAFGKMSPVEQAFLFGLYTGRIAESGTADSVCWNGKVLTDTVWKLREQVMAGIAEDEVTP